MSMHRSTWIYLILGMLIGMTFRLEHAESKAFFTMASPGGDFRLFYSAVGPLRFEKAPQIPSSFKASNTSGMMTARLKLKGKVSSIKWEVHPLFFSRPQASSSTVALNANPNQFPQAIPLSVDLVDDGQQLTQVRADRFLLATSFHDFTLTLGRQAITLGQGRAFTPLDRLAPFSPTSIDQQYKPGLDAVRLDFWWGVAGQASIIAAYRQSWNREGMAYVMTAQDHFGGWDIQLVLGEFQKDRLVGLSTAGSIGQVSIFGDFAWTWAHPDLNYTGDQASFGRASLGMSWGWSQGGGGQVSAEVYWQGDGADDVHLYLAETQDPRFLRGERWFLGRYYSMISIQQALTPLFTSTLSLLNNLEDGSGLVGTTIIWSVKQDVDAIIGGYGGYGEGLTISMLNAQQLISGQSPVVPQSEFGTLKWMGFAMMATYF